METCRTITASKRLLAPLALGLTLLAAFLLAGPPAARADLAPQGVSTISPFDNRLGTAYANYQTGDDEAPYFAPLVHAVGSRWDRVDFAWDRIQSAEATWTFSGYDELVDRQRDAGLDIIAILGSTPAWAADLCNLSAQTAVVLPQQLIAHPSVTLRPAAVEGGWQACPPRGLDLAWDHPDNVWGTFVYTTVMRYKDRVHVWEIWNEPDLWDWFWRGSVDDYAQLLRVGYQAVKAADPDATVLFAGLAYWADPGYYIAVLDALTTLPDAAQHNYFFDVMSLHLYSDVYQIGWIAAEIQANLIRTVGRRPIWLTETGVPLWDPWPPDHNPALRINRATSDEAAAYMIQAFAEARAAGVERFIVFRTHDDLMPGPTGDIPEYFGLIANDLGLRPAYHAFGVTAHYLQGENQVTGPFTHGGIRRITFWATPRGRVDVLWNTTGAPITYSHPAVLPTATLIDVRGQATTITATNAAFTLTLPAATANNSADGRFLIGGAPLLVLQEDTLPPTVALHTLPELVGTPSLTLTWDAADADSGYWYAEVARAGAPAGPWQVVADVRTTQDLTNTVVVLPASGPWSFRARARDRAGNWSPWSSPVSTTAILTRTVSLSVTTYLEEPGEVPTATVLSWFGPAGQLISTTVGTTWHITRTVDAGPHTLWSRAPDHLAPPHRFTVIGGLEPLPLDIALTLHPIRGRAFLPIITRGP